MADSSRSYRKVLLPLVVLAVSLGGFAALYASRPAKAPIEAREKAWTVALERVRLGDRAPTLTLFGRVESPQAARLTSAVAAYVDRLEVLEGQAIEAGQRLIILDPRDYELSLRQREAELAEIQARIASEQERHANDLKALEHEKGLLALSRRSVRRELDLIKKKLGTEANRDTALREQRRQALQLEQRQFAIAEHEARLARLHAERARVTALRDRAALDLERTRIRAPFPGRVTKTLVSPGDRVRVGDGLIEVYATNALEVRAQFPTRYLAEVRAALARGERLEGLAALGGERLPVVLDRLAGRVDRGSGGLDGLFRLPEDADLALGQTVELRLTLPARHAVAAVPVEAVYGTDRVYRVEDGRMRGIRVERLGELVGEDGQTRVLVRGGGLREGESLVVTQLPNAMEGLKVHVAGAATAVADVPEHASGS